MNESVVSILQESRGENRSASLASASDRDLMRDLFSFRSDVFELKKAPDGDGVLVPKVLLHLVHILQWKAPSASDTDAGDGDAEAEYPDSADPVRTKKAKTFLHVRCQLLMKALPKSVEVS